jgi:hypothetical protein
MPLIAIGWMEYDCVESQFFSAEFQVLGNQKWISHLLIDFHYVSLFLFASCCLGLEHLMENE